MMSVLMDSPVGLLQLTSDGGSVTQLLFAGGSPRAADSGDVPVVLDEARRQLEDYFAGRRQCFDLPLAARGSEFQHRVWHQLELIPYGATVSYGEVSRRLGLPPGAARAVGTANGSNPISIVVPCHRVIGANGTLTGYGGGLERKQFLLDLEAAQGLLFV